MYECLNASREPLMHRKLTIIFLFAILFAFAPQNSHAQTDCGDVTPTAGTAFDCTSTTGDAALNISGGVPDSVTNNPVVTVNSATGSAAFTSYDANVATIQTDGGDTVVIGGATAAAFRTDDESYTAKSGTGGNVATITAGTGDVNIDIHNHSKIKIEGDGGTGIVASSEGGKVVADFSNQGLIVSDKQGTNGLIANTVGGDIELSFNGIYSAIHLYGARSGSGKEYTVRDTKGATLTSTSGNITVELIDSAAIFASSVGESYGLAASTGGAGKIDITVANDLSCIVGKDGIIANTVSGNIDLALANGVVYGRGGGSTEGGNGIIATSTSGGDINIGGNGGSAIFADEAGSIAIEASTTGTLSVVAGEADGLSVWTEGGFAAINASTVNVVDADIGGNDSDFAILATGDVDVSGADVWTNKTEATTISTTGAVNVWNASKVRATGATANAISATTVVVNGSEVWTEGDTSNSIVTETLNVSNGGKVWANGAGSSAVSAGTSGTVNIVADDATGQVWTTVGGVSTVKGTTAYINDGVKVWANGAGSQAVSATTATVNGTDTQVWTSEGGTTDTIVATTVNIWNEAKVWANGVTSNAVTATTVTVNDAQVWSSGDTSNTVVTETLNVSGGGKVWANGATSSAVSAGSSGTVNIVADDATGEVWTTVDGVSTVKATTAYINDGVKVWANGAGSQAVAAETATVNGAGTQVWTEGGTTDTIVADTVNVSGGGKVWAEGDNSSAISAGESGNVLITSSDGDGEVWTTGTGADASTIKATGTVTVSGVEVWSNGTGISAIRAATVNVSGGAKVWTNGGAGAYAVNAGTAEVVTILSSDGTGEIWTDGDSKATITEAATVVVNGAQVWSNGVGASAIRAATVNVSQGAKVWSNGAGAYAVNAGTAEVVTILSSDGTGEIWTDGDSKATITEAATVVVNGAQVWSNGTGASTINTSTVNVSGGARVWANGAGAYAVNAGTAAVINIFSSDGMGEIWTDGAATETITEAATVKVHKAQVGSNGVGAITVRAATVNVSGGARIWAGGANSSAVTGGTSASVTIVSSDGMGEIWTGGGTNASTVKAITVSVHDGASVLTDSAGGNAVSATTVLVNGGIVGASGSQSNAIAAGGDVNIKTGAKVWSDGTQATTIRTAGDVDITTGSTVWSNGVTSNAVTARTVVVNGTNVWSNGATSNTAVAETLNISGGGKVWAEGATSSAVSAGTSGAVNIVADDATGQMWTTGNSSSTVKGTTAYINDGLKVWANGAGSRAVAATTATVNGAGTQVWTSEGGTADTISATTVNIWNDAQVWSNGDTSNAVTAITAVTVNGTNVWSNGATSNAVVTETLNISGEGKVWAEGTGSSAVSAGTSGTVNIVSADGTGQMWTTVDGVSTVKGTTAYINDGLKVWANGMGSQAVSATTATVNGADTQIWTEADTADTIVATTVNIWNSAQAWSSGDTSNTVVAETLNISGEGKVWAEGTGSSAVSAGVSGTVNIVSADGTGQMWTTVDGVSTVKGTTAYINDGLKVWANGAGSQAVSATTATVNSADTLVWTEGDTADTIVATTVNIWNSAQVWSSGDTSNTVVAETLNISGEGRVWAEGATSSAVSAGVSGTVNIVSADGTGQMWTTVDGVSTVKGTTAYINDGLKVWASGAGSQAVSATTATVNGADTQVWTEGDTTDTITATTVNIWNSANVWSNGATSNAVVADTVNVSGGGKVWAEGDNSSAISAGESGDVLITSSDADGEVWTTGTGADATTIKATGTATVSGVKVWSNGTGISAIRAATVNVSGGAKVWTNGGAGAYAVDAGTAEVVTILSSDGMGEIWTHGDSKATITEAATVVVNGAQVWSNGTGASTINTATVNVSGGARVWANGAGAYAVNAGTAAVINIFSSDGMGEIWTDGAATETITEAATVKVHKAKVGSNGVGAITVRAATVNVSGGARIWAGGANSSAVTGGTSASVTIVSSDGMGEIWTGGGTNASTVKATTVSVHDGASVLTDSAGGNAVSATTVLVNGGTVGASGDKSNAIAAGGDVNIKTGAKVWSDGTQAATIRTPGDVDITDSTVWSNGFISIAVSAGGSVNVNNSEVYSQGSSGADAISTTKGVTITRSRVHTNGTRSTAIVAGQLIANQSDIWKTLAGEMIQVTNDTVRMEIYDTNIVANGAGVPILMEATAGSGAMSVLFSNTLVRTLASFNVIKMSAGGSTTVGIYNGTWIQRAQQRGAIAVNAASSGSTTITVDSSAVNTSAGSNAIRAFAGTGTARMDMTGTAVVNTAALPSSTPATIEEGGTGVRIHSGSSFAILSMKDSSSIFTNGGKKSGVHLSSNRVMPTGTKGAQGITVTLEDSAFIGAVGIGANALFMEADAGSGTEGANLSIKENAKIFVEQTGNAVVIRTNGAANVSVAGSAQIYAAAGSSGALDITSNYTRDDVRPVDVTVKGTARVFTNGADSNVIITNSTAPLGFALARPASVISVEGSAQVYAVGTGSKVISHFHRISQTSFNLNITDSARVFANGAGSSVINIDETYTGAARSGISFGVSLDGTARAYAGGTGSAVVRADMDDGTGFTLSMKDDSLIEAAGMSDAVDVKMNIGSIRVNLEDRARIKVGGGASNAVRAEAKTTGTRGGTETSFLLTASGDSRIEAGGDLSRGIVSEMVNGETKIIISDKAKVSFSSKHGYTIRALSLDGDIGLYINGAAAAAGAAVGNPDSAYVSSGQSNTNTVRLQSRNGVITVSLKGGAQVVAGQPQYGSAAKGIYANSADGDINITLADTSQVTMRGHFLADAITTGTRGGNVTLSMSGSARLSIQTDRSSAFSAVTDFGKININIGGSAKVWATRHSSTALGADSLSETVTATISGGAQVWTEARDSTAVALQLHAQSGTPLTFTLGTDTAHRARVWTNGTGSTAVRLGTLGPNPKASDVVYSQNSNTTVSAAGADSYGVLISARKGNIGFDVRGDLFVTGDRSTAFHAQVVDGGSVRGNIVSTRGVGLSGFDNRFHAHGHDSKFVSVLTESGALARVDFHHRRTQNQDANNQIVQLNGDRAVGITANGGRVGDAVVNIGATMGLNLTGAGAIGILARSATNKFVAGGVREHANVIMERGSFVKVSQSSSTAIKAQTSDGGILVHIKGGFVYAPGATAVNLVAEARVQPSLRPAVSRKIIMELASTGQGGIHGHISGTSHIDQIYVNGLSGSSIIAFTGSGDLGRGADIVSIKNAGWRFTGTFAMGDGDDTLSLSGASYSGTGCFSSVELGGHTSSLCASRRRSASSGGDGRFRLGSAEPVEVVETEPESAFILLDFGEGEDSFMFDGTWEVDRGTSMNGLEKMTFGENATLVIMADPESVAGDPLIDLEGTITAEDIEGFNVEVDVPGTHVTEYTIFEAEALPDGEERQKVADRLSAAAGEMVSVETDGDGNLFLRATSHKDTSLDVYDALIQSAYRSDRNFADKLARGCGTGGAASDEMGGDFWTGCVWATSGGRYTRHTSAIQYDEDVYSFTGGVSAPFSGVLVSVAGGYEISTIDASAETAFDEDTRGLAKAGGDATRFMGGIFAEGVIDEFVVDGNLRYAGTSWEATRTADGDSYSADVDATVFGGAIAVTKPFLSGKFALLPRLELGASYITADKFVENSLAVDDPDTDSVNEETAADMDKFYVEDTSELLVYVNPSIEARSPVSEMLSMWMRAGADVQVLNPESEIEGRLIRDGANDGDPDVPENVLRDGTMDRVMFTYSAGMEYNPYDSLNISIEYGGGTSASFNTFVQQFRGGVNYRF